MRADQGITATPPPDLARQRRRWRRWRIGGLIAFYLVAFSASIPCIDTGNEANLARIHRGQADLCRVSERQLRAAGDAGAADRLAHSASRHDWLARAYDERAAQTRLTWSAWLLLSMARGG